MSDRAPSLRGGRVPIDSKETGVHVERSEDLDALPDPDSGKTEEERQLIVCKSES